MEPLLEKCVEKLNQACNPHGARDRGKTTVLRAPEQEEDLLMKGELWKLGEYSLTYSWKKRDFKLIRKITGQVQLSYSNPADGKKGGLGFLCILVCISSLTFSIV
jgi:hypothetical protein